MAGFQTFPSNTAGHHVKKCYGDIFTTKLIEHFSKVSDAYKLHSVIVTGASGHKALWLHTLTIPSDYRFIWHAMHGTRYTAATE